MFNKEKALKFPGFCVGWNFLVAATRRDHADEGDAAEGQRRGFRKGDGVKPEVVEAQRRVIADVVHVLPAQVQALSHRHVNRQDAGRFSDNER